MNKKTSYVRNGDEFVPYYIYKCKCCGSDIFESDPFEVFENNIYCGDCAFKIGIIKDDAYIKKYLYFLFTDKLRVFSKDGKIYITSGKFPWERKSSDRNTKEYSEWRESVYKRDKYTCQICKKVGGNLNAHHIKEYAKFPELRFEIDNGITLCEECHRKIHKKGGISCVGIL